MKKRRVEFRSDCPISTALDIFGDKWSLLVIRDLMFKGKNTYGEFLASEEKIATNILADRLAHLEWAGVISRHDHPDSRLKVLYKLTPKGIDLVPVLVEVVIWSEKYEKVSPLATEFVRLVKKDRGEFIRRAKESLKK